MAAGGLKTETVGADQSEKLVISFRQRGMKPQRKDAGDRKSEQRTNHPQPKPLPVQSAAGTTHQELDCAATNKLIRTDHQPSQNPCLLFTSVKLVFKTGIFHIS